MKSNSSQEYLYLPERLRDKVTYAKAIGEGSFGRVHLLQDKVGNSVYVLKQVSIIHLSDKEKAAAVDEALILSRLNHQNICKLFDFFLDDTSEYL